MQRWHLLMTKPRDDERAQRNLLNQDYEIFRPLLRRYRIRRGRQQAVLESLFPRYIFIHLDHEFSKWPQLRSTRGVAGLVRFNDMPAVVPDTLVDNLKALVDAEDIYDRTAREPTVYKAGDKVRISGGCFNGLEAVIKAQTGEERVIVLLDILGKTQSLKLPIDHIHAIA